MPSCLTLGACKGQPNPVMPRWISAFGRLLISTSSEIWSNGNESALRLTLATLATGVEVAAQQGIFLGIARPLRGIPNEIFRRP
jgi:hypothetical protein